MPNSERKSYPIIDPRDSSTPNLVTEPEREFILRELSKVRDMYSVLEQRFVNLESRLDTLDKKQSIPVTISGKGYTLTGSWKAIIGLAFFCTIIAVVYIIVKR